MNKDLFEKVKELKLPVGEYALFGSAPMAVRGLRDSRDIDIIVIDELFEICRNDAKWQVKRFDDGREYLTYENMEMFKNWHPGDWNINESINSAEIIDDLPFVKLENVIEWKKLYGREKDLNDIKIIEKFLRTNEK